MISILLIFEVLVRNPIISNMHSSINMSDDAGE